MLSLYRARQSVFHFSLQLNVKKVIKHPKKNKDSVNKLKSCAWKVSVEYLVALKC